MLSRTDTIIAACKESHLIGRETEKEDIIKLITTEDIKLEVICVYGMGGLGKTTLVRDVYQDENLSGKFEKRACTTIIRPFNAIDLLQNLASQFGYKDVPEMKSKLPGKKYLIVLDDLSSNAEWDTIIPHLPATDMSSRIIVTTRVKDIAMYCSKKHETTYKLKILEDSNALELFIKKVHVVCYLVFYWFG
jgi:predicted AAA+ superfamily ATPase